MSLDPVNLASDLIKIKSITPHGQEAINLIKSILENHGFDCKILDTRKTSPNFRYPEKWAVKIGGGENHRMGLFDSMIIKDNHIDYCKSKKSMLEWVDKLPSHYQYLKDTIYVESV